MNILLSRWSATAFVIGLFTVLAAGCVVPGGGYDAGYGLDYYEPYGIDFGGWGPGYHVAPYRDGDHRPVARDARESPPAYRAGLNPARSRLFRRVHGLVVAVAVAAVAAAVDAVADITDDTAGSPRLRNDDHRRCGLVPSAVSPDCRMKYQSSRLDVWLQTATCVPRSCRRQRHGRLQHCQPFCSRAH